MYNRFEKYADSHNMLSDKDIVIVGFSGGADSVCLLIMLQEYICRRKKNIILVAVHVHHGIRGLEADRDALFCKDFCEKNNILFRRFDYDVPSIAKERKLSEEEAGRILRYETFRIVEKEYKEAGMQTIIAVAHHMNDQAETLLLNLSRGTGIKGAMGIRPVRENIIRPLLCLERKDIEEYLAEHGQAYCTDSTNLEEEYIRNRIRKQVCYFQERINSGSVNNQCRFAERMAEINDYVENGIIKACNSYTVKKEQGIFVEDNLLQEHEVIIKGVLYRILESYCGYKDLQEKHIEYMRSLFTLQAGCKISLPRNVTCSRTYGGIIVFKNISERGKSEAMVEEMIIPDILTEGYYEEDMLKECTVGKLHIVIGSMALIFENSKDFININKKLANDYCTKYFDYDKIIKCVNNMGNYGLVLRYRKPGDYIVIDKDGHKKKIKQYFIDNKVPNDKREDMIMLALGNNIVWIPGMRDSAAFRIDEKTNRVMMLKWKND